MLIGLLRISEMITPLRTINADKIMVFYVCRLNDLYSGSDYTQLLRIFKEATSVPSH